ncbi:putative disease resistance RPP13-like protein 1 [Hordeum vulgare]|nr:putative disease resistance RPP13-like protein 1 [Hordeum vulgare]
MDGNSRSSSKRAKLLKPSIRQQNELLAIENKILAIENNKMREALRTYRCVACLKAENAYLKAKLARSFRNAAAILEADAQSEAEVGFSSTAPQISADSSATGPLQPSAAGSQDEPRE